MSWPLERAPFSRYGSYLSFSRFGPGKPVAPGLHLRAHFARAVIKRDVFLVELLKDGAATGDFATVPRPDRLTLEHPAGGSVQICFPEADRIRIRGEGVGLRFTAIPGTNLVAYPDGPRAWVVNARPACARFRFKPLVGELRADAPWGPEKCEHVRMDLLPGSEGVFDAALEVFQSTHQPRTAPSWDCALERVSTEWEHWRDRLPKAPARYQDAWEEAGYVLWSCTVKPHGQLKRDAVFMSKAWMDQVWSWDNCFNAMALCYGHPELAWDQIMLMADHQDEFGAFPDGLNPLFKHYNFSKPPVYGWALDFFRAQRPDFVTVERLREIYAPLRRFTRWWLEFRMPEGQRLPHYLHGNDSGWDNSTMFDQGVPLVAPDLTALLVIQMRELADIAHTLGYRKDAVLWEKQAQELLDALFRELWWEDHFSARLGHSNQPVHCESLIPYIPLVLGKQLPDAIAQALLHGLRAFLTEWGLATEKPGSPHYSADGYWRGPIWAPSTMLIVSGLLDLGQTELATEIAEKYARLCAHGGMAENHDALTGAGLRDPGYTWTSSVFLLLAHEVLFRGEQA